MGYICDGDVFETLEMAIEYANSVYIKNGEIYIDGLLKEEYDLIKSIK